MAAKPNTERDFFDSLQDHEILEENDYYEEPEPQDAPLKTARSQKRAAFEGEVIEFDQQLRKRQRRHEPIVLTNASHLSSILDEPDLIVDVFSFGLVYIVNHAFATEDLDTYSWLFTAGPSIDTWFPKPAPFMSKHGLDGQANYYTSTFPRHRHENTRQASNLPIVRLGSALRVLDDQSPERRGTQKVKFVTAVQQASCSIMVKQVISYSLRAALADIFHEILNGNSILFVSAVLGDVAIPVEPLRRGAAVKLQRCENLTEATGVEEGVIGVIC